MNWIKENWLLLFLATVISFAAYSSWELVSFVKSSFGTFFPQDASRGDWGTLGDLFGGLLNPFFALLGLVMLLVTLFQNQRELSLSRKEFEESADALKLQAITQEKQRFEDTFFSLMSQHNNLLNTITADRTSINEGGQSIHDSFASTLKVELIGGGSYHPIVELFNHLGDSRLKMLNGNNEVNQYFRLLYQILKFIYTNCPREKQGFSVSMNDIRGSKCTVEEKMYTNIVRAMLPQDVCLLLFINCACEKGSSFYNYRLLLERYAFFEHIAFGNPEFINTALVKETIPLYKESVFGQNTKYLHYK